MHQDRYIAPNLPPDEARLFNPSHNELIDTPIDYRGIVDLDELIKIVKATVVPEYDWTSRMNDVHHLQWHAALYKNNKNPGLALEFRNLINRRAYLPRVFHNWIHRITIPSPVPDEDVMRYCVDAQRVAMNLHSTAANALRLARSKTLGEHALRLRLDQAFEYYNLYVDNARLVPEEFRLVALDDIEVDSVEQMLTINRKLGRMAIARVPIRNRTIQAVA